MLSENFSNIYLLFCYKLYYSAWLYCSVLIIIVTVQSIWAVDWSCLCARFECSAASKCCCWYWA